MQLDVFLDSKNFLSYLVFILLASLAGELFLPHPVYEKILTR